LTRINIPTAPNEQTVAAVIRQIPALPQGGGWAITAMSSFTNRTYRIERDGEAFILRLPGQGTERYIDRVSEIANIRAAASIGIAPEVVFADAASGVMVTRFFEGAEPLSPQRLRGNADLIGSVDLLHRLHDSGLTFKGVMRLYPKMDEYLKLAPAPELLPLRRAVEPLRPILEAGWGPLRPCHIDPAPQNFITAGAARYLVDWEYAAMCDPLWDLAGLSIEGEFDTEQDTTMLTRYLGAAEPPWLSRLYLYRLVLRLLAASWWAVQRADGNGPSGAGATVSRLESSVAADLGDPALLHHIEAASSPAT
jgi:thiamine kinase-like enzyme